MQCFEIALTVWSDERFRAFARFIGNEDRAFGICGRAWALASQQWTDGRKLISPDIWKLGGFDGLIEVGLAEERPDGIYVRGTVDRNEWLAAWNDGRKKGGQARAAKAKRGLNGAFVTKKKPSSPPLPIQQEPAGAGQTSSYPPASTSYLSCPVRSDLSDKQEESLQLSSGSTPVPKPTPRDLVELWNSLVSGTMILVHEINPGTERWRRANARLKEQPDLDVWRSLIERCKKNPAFLGQQAFRDGTTWTPDFDWLVKPATRVKIIEGKCDAKIGSKPALRLEPTHSDLVKSRISSFPTLCGDDEEAI